MAYQLLKIDFISHKNYSIKTNLFDIKIPQNVRHLFKYSF